MPVTGLRRRGASLHPSPLHPLGSRWVLVGGAGPGALVPGPFQIPLILVGHVPAKQAGDGCKEAGLEDEGHPCDHEAVPELHVVIQHGELLQGSRTL